MFRPPFFAQAHNEDMAVLDAAVLVFLVLIVVYATLRLLERPSGPTRRPVAASGRWRVAHYDVESGTRVVLQRVSPDATVVQDEHVIAEISTDDPEYDAKFLTAMSTARERRAMFEAEDD